MVNIQEIFQISYQEILDIYRNEVPFLADDRLLHNDIENSILFLQNLAIDEELL